MSLLKHSSTGTIACLASCALSGWLGLACSSPSNPAETPDAAGSVLPDASGKETGTEGAPCFANATCMEGLTCRSGMCVNTAKDPGTEGGPCFPNSTCMDGLTCEISVCVRTSPDQDAGTPADAGVPVIGTTKTIDSTGGSIALEGATLTIPAGAVATPTAITVTQTADPAPSGYAAYSPLFKFEPEGTTFDQPVTISLRYQGDSSLATLFWSRTGTTGFARLSTSVSGGVATAQVTHFSKGFVANGVDYSEPPDRTCVRERLIHGRTFSQSAVALFFEVDDCQGRPITGLSCEPNGGCDFTVKEDGTRLPVEAVPSILPAKGLTIFASLVIDTSS
ncbi:MAG: hypothetical protein HY901_19515, partial [Deltaproteobacteria bacterium]|nr:hypothetical protein [Deltaproteobacteria bacterium]